MKDKYIIGAIYIVLYFFIIMFIVFASITIVLMYRDFNDKKVEVNVLPKNEDKKLVEPDEVRQYVLEMARREKLNVDMVDKIGNCESK